MFTTVDYYTIFEYYTLQLHGTTRKHNQDQLVLRKKELHTTVLFIGTVFAVFSVIAFPILWNAFTIRSTLELYFIGLTGEVYRKQNIKH